MFSGKRFRILSPTLALDETDVPHNSMTLPVGAIINVIDGPKPDVSLVRVVWEKRWLLMHEQDIREHAEEIQA